MKIYKLILILLVNLISSTHAQNLDKMSPQARNEQLTIIAKNAVLKYGPGYYRTDQLIQDGYISDDMVSPDFIRVYNEAVKNKDQTKIEKYQWVKDILNGRKWYIVTYSYDDEEEFMEMDYAAIIYIWADTGKAFVVDFGIGIFRVNIDKDEVKGRGVGSQVKYVKRPPLPKIEYNPLRDSIMMKLRERNMRMRR